MVFEYYANFYSFARSHFIIVFTKIDLLEEYMKEEDVNVFLRDAGILMDDEERVTTATEYMNILQRYLLGLMTSADARERMRFVRANLVDVDEHHPAIDIFNALGGPTQSQRPSASSRSFIRKVYFPTYKFCLLTPVAVK